MQRLKNYWESNVLEAKTNEKWKKVETKHKKSKNQFQARIHLQVREEANKSQPACKKNCVVISSVKLNENQRAKIFQKYYVI